jgi:integrase
LTRVRKVASASITETLQQAIIGSGMPLQARADVTGVERASLSRFVAGKRSLRLDMADKLAAYFKLEARRPRQARSEGDTKPGEPWGPFSRRRLRNPSRRWRQSSARLPPYTPLFDVPEKLSKILSRDLRLAGIPKRGDRGRTLDVHALRHTFGTLMSMGGIAPRTAHAAMRNSKIDLTMSVYTDRDCWTCAAPSTCPDAAPRR